MAQLMPLPLTVSCFSKIQIGFTFLVAAYPGSPGQRAIKRVQPTTQPPYNINKQTIYVAPKQKIESKAHYAPQPTRGPLERTVRYEWPKMSTHLEQQQ